MYYLSCKKYLSTSIVFRHHPLNLIVIVKHEYLRSRAYIRLSLSSPLSLSSSHRYSIYAFTGCIRAKRPILLAHFGEVLHSIDLLYSWNWPFWNGKLIEANKLEILDECHYLLTNSIYTVRKILGLEMPIFEVYLRNYHLQALKIGGALISSRRMSKNWLSEQI